MVSLSFFCLLVCSFSVFSVICHGVFRLYVATDFFCSPVVCPKLGLYLVPLQSVCFIFFPSVSCCFSHIFHLCHCYYSYVSCFNRIDMYYINFHNLFNKYHESTTDCAKQYILYDISQNVSTTN